MKRLAGILALVGSTGTLVCCFLPAVFVALGLGATFAAMVGAFPQIIWLSENKPVVFAAAGAWLVAAALYQRRAAATACPLDPKLAEGCQTARHGSRWMLRLAFAIYALGFSFAFILPRLTA